MHVAIVKIVSAREFGVILSARILESDHARAGHVVRIKASNKTLIGRPEPGEVWEVEGELIETAWGPQVEASRAWRRLPTGRLVRDYLSNACSRHRA